MDFFQISTKETKGGLEIYPDFLVGRSKDLMIQGRSFYAIWDEKEGLWSRDEYDVQRLVDEELLAEAAKTKGQAQVKLMRSSTSGSWARFKAHIANLSDNNHPLDNNLVFANTEVKKSDYASKRLPYSLEHGDHSAWDELVGTLYSIEEKAKIEWAIGAIVAGDAKRIQKFLVLYGPGGTGKSTVLNIIEKLFQGYTAMFEAKQLGSNNNAFATEVFKGNPLVAIQHDGDLSNIQDNTKLNSIISHEKMTMNEKYKPAYDAQVNAFCLMGTNTPVKISDSKSGIIRRLIDVHPTGVLIPSNHYNTLVQRVDFELGAIAQHCLDTYRSMGKNYYSGYRPTQMMMRTDVFFNFIEYSYDVFKSQDSTTLTQAYSMYKEFCSDAGIEKPIPRHIVREELRTYFEKFHERTQIDGQWVRSYYQGFSANHFKQPADDGKTYSLVLDETKSIFDDEFPDQPAQYAKANETPKKFWTNDPRMIGGEMKEPKPHQVVSTTLKDIDTSELHFVKMPPGHIVIDFDLKDENGEKSLERNLQAASTWPATYGELSKGGNGVHLHYLYEGDTTELALAYSEGIEVKTFHGEASLRRRLTKCNAVPIAKLNVSLPKKEKKVLTATEIKSEKGLRDLIARNLRKEIHPGTKPSIDFIAKILQDAFDSGLTYDVTDLRPKIMAFANNSSNQAFQCLKIVQKMKFASELRPGEGPAVHVPTTDERLVFFDIEVYPNLFMICWKFQGSDQIVTMINPKPHEVEQLFSLKLIGFNNRRYDNHIIYAASMGYNNAELYELSQKIINNQHTALFGEAYNLSYTDIYDYSSKKQGLKKFEIELGLPHKEMDLPWDEPVPAERFEDVAEYCRNDVNATEAVHKAREQDFVARQILADLSGLSVNSTTQQHTAKVVFGAESRNPQKHFIYTDLSKEFPGYKFEMGKSTYRDEITGEGGYVYSEPGMYEDVAVLDIASMHPTTIKVLNMFGSFTPNFTQLLDARVAIKRGNYDEAKKMLDGKLAPYLTDEKQAKELSYALKIVINIVYGLTSAKFPNPFRDSKNVDNIVAKRGALFMIDLKHAVQEQGFTVAHIKTDSIKIPNATPEIIQFVSDFGAKYGYEFEHESTYEKFCLVNDAVYIARENGKWTATGAQFAHPYVFKTLFSGEDLVLSDYFETKNVVQGVMYLDTHYREGADESPNKEDMVHVGRTGQFVPVLSNGGVLYRVKDDKFYAVTGTKDHKWMETSVAKIMGDDLEIDMSYFEKLREDAFNAIDYYGSFAEFVK